MGGPGGGVGGVGDALGGLGTASVVVEVLANNYCDEGKKTTSAKQTNARTTTLLVITRLRLLRVLE